MTALRFPRVDARLLLLLSLPAALASSMLGAGLGSVSAAIGMMLALELLLVVAILFRRALLDEAASVVASCQACSELAAVLRLRAPLPPMTGWAAHPELAALLARRVLCARPSLVVEAGSGVSTLVHAYALEKNGSGRVVSLDHEPTYAARTRDEIEALGLANHAEVVDAPLVEHRLRHGTMLWYSLERLPPGPIDLLLVDGPPVGLQSLSRYPAVPLLVDRLTDGAWVVLDDADRASERAVVERWLAEYPGRFERRHHATRKGVTILVHRIATPA